MDPRPDFVDSAQPRSDGLASRLRIKQLLSIKDAAETLGLGVATVRRLIKDADENKGSTWRYGREIIDLTPSASKNRTIRIDLAAVSPSLAALADQPELQQSQPVPVAPVCAAE